MKKELLVNCGLLFILMLIFVFLFAVIHETTHYFSCEIVGLNGNITIDIFQDPPLFMNTCEGINEKSTFSKYLVWGSPYIIDLILMILLLIYLPKNKFYLLSIPAALILSVFFNYGGFYKCATGKACRYGNDLFNLYFKARYGLYTTLIFMVLSIIFFIFIAKKYIFNFAKKINKSKQT